MTNSDYTALLFVVDRSGSMARIATDMEGGIETLLKEQRQLPGKLTIDYIRFDNVVEYVSSMADPASVEILIDPRNSTALFDAVGTGINEFGAKLAAMSEEDRPGKVIVAIVTDGMENASREFDATAIKTMIEHQADTYGWTFVYLGADQDAVLVAGAMGIGARSAITYAASADGTYAVLDSLSEYIGTTRTVGSASFTEEDRQSAAT